MSRLIAAKKKLLFLGEEIAETVQSLPAMTSDTSPAGHVASASSALGGYDAFKAFDKAFGAGQDWLTAGSGNGWVQRQMPSPIKVLAYRVVMGFEHNPFTSLSLEGSNNGSSWTTLDSQSGLSGWSAGTSRQFTITTPGFYSYYRLNVSGASSYVGVGDLELLQPQ